MHEGHRERLREKLVSHRESLTDIQALEMLLFNSISRKDTNPLAHDLLDSGSVAEPVAGYHGVFDMFFEVVDQRVGYRGYTTLSKIGVGLFQFGFANEGYFSFVCYFESKTHSGDTGTDD